ncbi:hypothetical protein GE21DRAFT_4105 [Neurospora crassa]|uniref:Uncharacterized protein n=1 Tax=Neurospora crassa (strain ATCC 24698 / 74-OR23-1A / CBS 708.71 / DSM 1257 / FGSC 987) TaxID=367110 RepID=U9W2S9_NEUCR|nr:hypothetical protein NCU16633 [Neurospora crassa OR74A]ESA43176.1 hypothetical protein NCU16633 [Neurospora crassa OR74A]KHE85476.1 hypothetical protein GE21DRAFT_4105 [Neurospora crassa]|eukprot:XP_011394026.1 hypothetical protein NCU16633 [Neurospora crassa OR74A]
MASEAKPPILAVPLEIRFEIYRHTWTIPFSDARELSEGMFGRWSSQSLNSEMCYFNLQVRQLHALVSICRQIRNEVLSEYFHQTQVIFCNRLTISPEIQHPAYSIAHRIQSSLLFASYTQHVRIRWITNNTSTLVWLLQLKRLKTLELIIDGPPRCVQSILDQTFDSSLFWRLTTLRNLEKLVVLIDCVLRATLYVQRIKDIPSKSVEVDLIQPEEQPTYVFKQLIGFDVHV